METKKIYDILLKASNDIGDREAIVDDYGKVTYSQFFDKVNIACKKLIDIGVNDTKKIAICGNINIDAFALYIATLTLGGKVTILNPYIDISLLSKLIVFADIDYIVFSKSIKYDMTEDSKQSFSINTNIDVKNIYTTPEIYKDSEIYNLEEIKQNIIEKNRKVGDFLFYTSGTESFPKLSYTSEDKMVNLAYEVSKVATPYLNGVNNKFFIALPYNHLYSVICTLLVLIVYKETVYMTAKLMPEYICELIGINNINSIVTIPALFNGIATSKLSNCLKDNLKIFVSSGSVISNREYDLYNYKIPDLTILCGYGITECGLVSIMCTKNDKKIVGNTGKLIGGQDVKIASNGEILIKSAYIKDKYYKLDADKQGIDSDGYFHTGDIGEFDEAHNLYVKGRIKDIIIKGGENISPLEIENEILKDNNVEKAVVAPKPDDKYGEEIYAYVILKDKSKFDENLMKEKIGEALGHFKIPKKIIIKDKFPLNSLGKIVKNEL